MTRAVKMTNNYYSKKAIIGDIYFKPTLAYAQGELLVSPGVRRPSSVVRRQQLTKTTSSP